MDQVGAACAGGKIVLTQVNPGAASVVHARLAELGAAVVITARELLRVLAYSEFKLSQTDRERLLEDLLSWCGIPMIRCFWS